MQNPHRVHKRSALLLFAIGLAFLPVLLLLGVVTTVFGETPLTHAGYLDFSYADPDFEIKAPTGEKAESKLWWNDGYWWGSMYNAQTNAFHIYRLQLGSQTWVDTGVKIDDLRDPLNQEMTKADAFWDAASEKLYILSHVYTKHGSAANASNYARLLRYSYDPVMQTYTLDSDFTDANPVYPSKDKTETMVIDKDSKGRLWTTYVSRSNGSDYKVYVNSSKGGSLAQNDNWNNPMVVPGPITHTHVTSDDISSLVAFDGNIAIMWSNQLSHTLNLALHDDDQNPNSGWVNHAITLPLGTGPDDHLSIKSLQANASGQLFAVIKIENVAAANDPAIVLVAMDTDGKFSFHTYSTKANGDTRPILLIDETANELYVFVTGKSGGSKICYKTLEILPPGQLGSMGNFPPGDCGAAFIEDDVYKDFNNATSTKGAVNALTGIVVLAADDKNGQFYAHNSMGTPPPVVDAVTPGRNQPGIPLTSTISATFSQEMNAATISNASFLVESASGPIAGVIGYDAATHMAVFTPNELLAANTTYTVKLTDAIKALSGQSLNEGIESTIIRETWQFTTTSPQVQFSETAYSVPEAGVATITATLSVQSATEVTVDYMSHDITATDSVDYVGVTNTLTFAPGETMKAFMITTSDDNLAEGYEDVGLTLLNPVSATLGLPYTATLTIIDDDLPMVQFDSASYMVQEDGSATMTATLTVPSVLPIQVDYATHDMSALAGVDYSSASGTLFFAAGETVTSFTVATLPDPIYEGNEDVGLSLTNPVNADLGVPDTAILTIVDDETMPTVQFSASSFVVSEHTGPAQIEVALSGPSAQDVTVDFMTSDGTAVAGDDYTAVPLKTLTFTAGQTSQSVDIAVMTDTEIEAAETVNLTLSNVAGANMGSPSTATLTINNFGGSYDLYLPIVIR